MKVYALYLGDNNNCTDIQLNYDNGESVSYVEFADNPVLFDSDTAAGTYGCMVIKASDIIKFTPNAEAVAAITECGAEEYGHDIFWYDGGENSEEWYDPSTGEVVAAEGNRANHVEQDVYLYFPYDPDAALSANSKLSPNQIIPMSSKIEIVEGGATSGTLMIDFTNKVEQDMGYCTLDSPEVEFTLSVE